MENNEIRQEAITEVNQNRRVSKKDVWEAVKMAAEVLVILARFFLRRRP